MGSVLSECKCPQCGGVMVQDYYYKTDEDYKICPRCGKSESWTLIRDANGKVLRNKDGTPKYQHKRHRGYGCAGVAGKNGVSQIFAFDKPVTKSVESEFFEMLDDDNVNKTKSYLTSWNTKTGVVDSIYGDVPSLYDENK